MTEKLKGLQLMPGSSVFTASFSLNVPVFLELQRCRRCVALKRKGPYTANTDTDSVLTCYNRFTSAAMKKGSAVANL